MSATGKHTLPPSELILNADGSIYHLKLLPEDIADTIITVGDPDRVPMVSKYFDTIEVKKQKREFTTHTGRLNGKRITCISTGIGSGNIDILMNELDALANIDFKTRTIKPEHKALTLVRLGTSGCIQDEVPLDTLVASRYAIGLDGLLNFYPQKNIEEEAVVKEAFFQQVFFNQPKPEGLVYVTKSSDTLIKQLDSLNHVYQGITVTLGGFYAPQGRCLRLALQFPEAIDLMRAFSWNGNKIINLEMETAALYGLSALLGHHCCSVSSIIAHRHSQIFSRSPEVAVEQMIERVLSVLVR